jgi:Zn-dependent M16 (insulinase) family peptidase
MFDQNYFLTRLQNGEDLDKIGKEIADMMNKASAEFTAQKEAEAKAKAAAEAEKNIQKKELVEELIDIIQELAILEGMDPEDMTIADGEIDELVEAFTEMFAAMRDLKNMFAAASAKKPTKLTPVKKSDDQILADFLKTII